MANYPQRDLFGPLVDHLTESGVMIATETNLKRNKKPGRSFLVDSGELPTLTRGVEILHHSEAWRDNGRHETHFVGRCV